jgi:hypothetical protein
VGKARDSSLAEQADDQEQEHGAQGGRRDLGEQPMAKRKMQDLTEQPAGQEAAQHTQNDIA